MSQMDTTVEHIVSKRRSNFDYIKRAHQGKVHWLNVLRLTKSMITRNLPQEKLQKRTRRWFMLGLSVGRLVNLEAAHVVVALAQLLEEYEHFTHHSGGSYRKAMGGVDTHLKSWREAGEGAPIKAMIQRGKDRKVMYMYLQTQKTCTANALDFCEIVYSLCDVMSSLYNKFLDPSCSPHAYYEAILKIDRKVQHQVIGKMVSDLTAVAKPAMNLELRGLLSHTFLDNGPASNQFVVGSPIAGQGFGSDAAGRRRSKKYITLTTKYEPDDSLAAESDSDPELQV